LQIARLRQAVDIYLSFAYPSCPVPPAVLRRLEWSAGLDASELLTHSPFERASRSAEHHAPVYALRLGNLRYPHMKLQIQPWTHADGFLLSVNTHDQVLGLDPNAPDAQLFRELQAENQQIKELIEQAWEDAGLPTFHRYLREYMKDRPSSASPTPCPEPDGGETAPEGE
jgi:hypothetical protein